MIKIGDKYYDHRLPVGSKIKFSGEKQKYTVQASNIFYSVCTKPFNPKHTVLYTVINWYGQIRGTENLVFGMGAETRKDCEEMLVRLTNGETEISRRNNIPLDIEKVYDPELN